jgi:hypothetical protein
MNVPITLVTDKEIDKELLAVALAMLVKVHSSYIHANCVYTHAMHHKTQRQ